MTTIQRVRVAAAVAALVTAAGWAALAQEPKTTTEKIKEKVGSAVTSVKKGVYSAEEAIKNQFSKMKESVVAMNTEARVYARLHWDKALAASKVELHAPRAGVIELTGTVSDAKAHAKALELTNDTTGVTEVVDHLTVSAATTTTTTTTTTETPPAAK